MLESVRFQIWGHGACGNEVITRLCVNDVELLREETITSSLVLFNSPLPSH